MMDNRHGRWTEGKIWQFRGHQARVAGDGASVELKKCDGSMSTRFLPTITHQDLIDFIIAAELPKRTETNGR